MTTAPQSQPDLLTYLTERNRAFATLDIEWARKQLAEVSAGGRIPMPSDSVLLLTLHKARHQCMAIQSELRIESARWLKERGYGDMMGQPINNPTELPK